MEYPDGCSTAMRHVARKVGLYDLEVVSLRGCYFWTGGLAYDNYIAYIINFIQLVSLQPVDQFSQANLCCKAPNKGYPHIYGMYKSDNK